MSSDDLVFLRAKLSIARFFPDAQDLINFIAETFTNRISDGQAIGDIADVYGKTIDEQKIAAAAKTILAQQGATEEVTKTIDGLTQDERMVLAQYLGIQNLVASNNTQYQDFLNNFIGQSLG